jgi:hypothetical protein
LTITGAKNSEADEVRMPGPLKRSGTTLSMERVSDPVANGDGCHFTIAMTLRSKGVARVNNSTLAVVSAFDVAYDAGRDCDDTYVSIKGEFPATRAGSSTVLVDNTPKP